MYRQHPIAFILSLISFERSSDLIIADKGPKHKKSVIALLMFSSYTPSDFIVFNASNPLFTHFMCLLKLSTNFRPTLIVFHVHVQCVHAAVNGCILQAINFFPFVIILKRKKNNLLLSRKFG